MKSSYFVSIAVLVGSIALLSMVVSLGSAAPSEPTFVDVPFDHPYHDYIEVLYQEGYVAGCSTDPLMYCPDQIMNRAESAVFVERGTHWAEYMPAQPTEQFFADVPISEWFAKWSTALRNDGYTDGCGTDPLVYCPLQEHTRTEGSVFFLRMMHGVDYVPPEPQGIFTDVSLDWWGAKWVEAAYSAGLIPACETEPEPRFCPDDPLDRAMGAYMMVQAKDLPLPTPTMIPTETALPTSTPSPMPSPTHTPNPSAGAIIADHTTVDLSQIPDEWIEQVKQNTRVYYGHASHGAQLTGGLDRISDRDSFYAFAEGYSLPQVPNTLDFLSTYNDPDMFFSEVQGILDANPSINVAMFAWCGEASWYDIDLYTSQMEALEAANPDVTFVYMTGNTQEGFDSGYERYLFNQALRQYAREHDKVLFDFADLDVWYGDEYTPDVYDYDDYGRKPLVTDIPLEHPQWHGDDWGHTTWESCENKAKAVWWMLAKITGWNGE